MSTAATTPAPALGEAFELFLSASKHDSQGREIGYVVGFRDNGVDFYAWVQNARRAGACDWADYGVPQRSRLFKSAEASTAWAYRTARERIAKLTA